MIKHILHVTFDMSIGGAEQVIYHLIQQTDRDKYKVSLFCIDSPLGQIGVKLRTLGYSITNAERKAGFDVSLVKALHLFIKTHNIDVVHCHQYTPYVYGVLGAIGTDAKVIFTEHGRFFPDLPSRKRKIVNPFLSLITKHITAISAATKKSLHVIENFPRNKIKVIYNGIEGKNYLEGAAGIEKVSIGIPENSQVLGTVARLDPIKNQLMMIKAMPEILKRFPKTVLLIVGDGPERKNLESACESLQVSKDVIFTGFREDIPDLMQIIDIFLLTSFSEGTAMTLLEAMAAGRPCIATRVGGNPEIVVDEVTGYLVENDNPDTLSQKICALLGNKALLEEMGRNGRQRFLANFTVHQMASQYQELYEGK